MAERYSFTVNGVKRSVQAEPKTPVMDVIRREWGLTGTKHGCDNGTCGACSIVVNGKAVKSCLYTLERIGDGAEIVTVEGLARGTELHPVQQALIDAGAVQCGFCIPGIVMELYALSLTTEDPSDDELKKAVGKHLCRCTGYEAIVDGARLAQKYLKEMKSPA